MDQAQQAVFKIEKLYVKDLSLEVPNAPAIYLDATTPEVNVDIATQAGIVGDGFYEVTLSVTVTAKIAEDEKVLFLVEVAQSGVFQIRNVPQEELEPILLIGCANILFPYVREAVSDAVTRAGFQPVLLSPVNFEAMYEARQQQLAAEQPKIEVPIQ
ncbi:MAG: protein-export chaperone SecB [Candidatus Dactylopiibacterium carminicum]|uniref:Protein-export protein SecB n=1 Tax=Candidatus Dactylopiibacterium carminicum TaxID=857335 RepID=A0A272EMP3_9RHOO|nr:protein-export chaperone SecB [Candidatus Dactylopiibacterium carminicum]KAF7597785.1 protein-export chaperone SecB [Candidatus Dactylopiibacterium carminicum]PAS91375.1 MAG: protein-export chaperone SecB [Candidatus Dactylopiibacterium carminicum]PAS92381.1 MAG: protein-export chaperone SecB [Candidatus Dactylopiibacterium carminicum]PAS95529.1 MAG: protein-export chaperone SecB [Candidatus Dactylopiibacterium carminicum]